MTLVKKGEIPYIYFEGLDQWIKDNQTNAKEVRWAMDKIVHGYALVALGAAQKMSLGPLDPQNRRGAKKEPTRVLGMLGTTKSGGFRTYRANPAAWKIPVRRISGDYYASWEVQRMGVGHWQLKNSSREAYFIEMGIAPRGGGVNAAGGRVRIRRPILKLAVVQAVKFAQATRLDEKAFLDFLARHATMGGEKQQPGYRVPAHIDAGVVSQLTDIAGQGQ